MSPLKIPVAVRQFYSLTCYIWLLKNNITTLCKKPPPPRHGLKQKRQPLQGEGYSFIGQQLLHWSTSYSHMKNPNIWQMFTKKKSLHHNMLYRFYWSITADVPRDVQGQKRIIRLFCAGSVPPQLLIRHFPTAHFNATLSYLLRLYFPVPWRIRTNFFHVPSSPSYVSHVTLVSSFTIYGSNNRKRVKILKLLVMCLEPSPFHFFGK